jgi:hypothetical protein
MDEVSGHTGDVVVGEMQGCLQSYAGGGALLSSATTCCDLLLARVVERQQIGHVRIWRALW